MARSTFVRSIIAPFTLVLAAASAAAVVHACSRPDASGNAARDTAVVFVAASLAKPLQPIFAAYSSRRHAVIQTESGASIVLARRITELHRIPDLIILADPEVFPELLMPRDVTWYAQFARNHMVVAYTARSKYAGEITPANWIDVLRRPDVQIGRTDPAIAPVGYRTLIMFQLAQRFYRRAGLAQSLLSNAPERNVRPDAAESAALLAAGELDYIYDYQSVAESNGFRFISLPREIDLGDPTLAGEYAMAQVRVRRPGSDTVIAIAGQPITYALSVPEAAPHATAGKRLMTDLLSPTTVRSLRAAHVDMLDHPIIAGSNPPAELRDGSGP
jgi:molybdate/tungstate transport system substrate-binding protein